LGSSLDGYQSAFLYGNIQEEIEMQQPSGFIQNGPIPCVCKLNKYLYSLEQSPHASCGFTHCEVEHDLYICHHDGKALIIVLYVDDLILTNHFSFFHDQ